MPDATVAGPGSERHTLPAKCSSCGPGQRPCSTGRAAPSRGRSGRLPGRASSAPGPGIHLTDGPHVKMKTSSMEIYPGLWQACPWDGASLIPEEPVTFSGDLHGDATCRGPEIEAGVACAQSQPGLSGVPLEATHS